MRTRLMVLTILVALAATVLVSGCSATAESAAPAAPQTIAVSADGVFVPSATAKAGVPIRLEFGPGSGCTQAVQFADFGVWEDLTDGGGIVDLPALSPGTYPLVCQADMVMGTLEVQ